MIGPSLSASRFKFLSHVNGFDNLGSNVVMLVKADGNLYFILRF
jgi:hypothetical protein